MRRGADRPDRAHGGRSFGNRKLRDFNSQSQRTVAIIELINEFLRFFFGKADRTDDAILLTDHSCQRFSLKAGHPFAVFRLRFLRTRPGSADWLQ